MSTEVGRIEGDTIYSSDGTMRVQPDNQFDIWKEESVMLRYDYMDSDGWQPMDIDLFWSESEGLWPKESIPRSADGRDPRAQYIAEFLLFVEKNIRQVIDAARASDPEWRRTARKARWAPPFANGIEEEAPPELASWIFEALRHGWRPDETDLRTLDRPTKRQSQQLETP